MWFGAPRAASRPASATRSVFDWDDYLTLARRLASEPDEASRRSAISRAYYAAYHAAASYVRAKRLVPASRSLSHRLVWAIFATDPDPDRADVGARGRDLQQVRNLADYGASFPGNLERRTRGAIVRSQTLLDLIDALP